MSRSVGEEREMDGTAGSSALPRRRSAPVGHVPDRHASWPRPGMPEGLRTQRRRSRPEAAARAQARAPPRHRLGMRQPSIQRPDRMADAGVRREPPARRCGPGAPPGCGCPASTPARASISAAHRWRKRASREIWKGRRAIGAVSDASRRLWRVPGRSGRAGRRSARPASLSRCPTVVPRCSSARCCCSRYSLQPRLPNLP